MKIRTTKGLTFDDVLLIPQKSGITSRGTVDTSTRLTDKIRINIPILSANMDTVTEAGMAIAMANAGGIGIIHRFMSIEQLVKQVNKVKRAQAVMVENPYCINISVSIAKAREVMRRFSVGGLIVTDDTGRVEGILTSRDVNLAPDESAGIQTVMTSREHLVAVGPQYSIEEARKLLFAHRIEKLPVINQDGTIHGLITSKDVLKPMRNPNAALDTKGRLLVGAAIGVSGGELERAEELIKAGADVLVMDIAHGHADHCLKVVNDLTSKYPSAQIIAGNVASREGARDLAAAGANAIKVGIGPGSICTTRIVTGFGVPQLTAIMDSAMGISDARVDIPLIADGGIQKAGDLVKSLAAGAESVMIGSLFAGTEEAPGNPVIRDGTKVKVVRGMASLGANLSRKAVDKGQDESAEDSEDWMKVVPEGVEAVVPYRGNVGEVLHQLVGGLRSGLSYGGASTIKELQNKAEFIEITNAGLRESGSHDVRKL